MIRTCTLPVINRLGLLVQVGHGDTGVCHQVVHLQQRRRGSHMHGSHAMCRTRGHAQRSGSQHPLLQQQRPMYEENTPASMSVSRAASRFRARSPWYQRRFMFCPPPGQISLGQKKNSFSATILARSSPRWSDLPAVSSIIILKPVSAILGHAGLWVAQSLF